MLLYFVSVELDGVDGSFLISIFLKQIMPWGTRSRQIRPSRWRSSFTFAVSPDAESTGAYFEVVGGK